MCSADQPPFPTETSPEYGVGGGGEDSHSAPTRWGICVAVATGAALLAAAVTTGALWLTGAFDREVVRIIEVIEVPGSETPSALPDDEATSPVSESIPAAPNAEIERTSHAVVPIDPISTVAARAIPSIVSVQAFDESSLPAGSGSGVIFRSDGFIITNDHVIDGATTLRVIMSDGYTYPATLVGSDPLMDIAVLKVEALGLTNIELGSMDSVRTGDPAIAVGNPLGLDGGPSVTAGVVSAFDRTLITNLITGDSMYGLLQTDAPITRGSSGGALLDAHGRLLGITTAIGISDVGAEGLGFAVPVNLVERIVDDLVADGEVRHAFLGIRGSSAFAERENGVESPLGVEIRLLDDSAMAAAGAEDGDVIVALDGDPVMSMPVLVARLRNYRAGDSITVTVDRGEQIMDIDLVLDLYPS